MFTTPFIFPEKVVQWGIVHLTLTRSFNNYINITFIDEKFNLGDLCVDVIKTHCPLQPGIYHFSYSRELLKIFRPVSATNTMMPTLAVLLIIFLGSILW